MSDVKTAFPDQWTEAFQYTETALADLWDGHDPWGTTMAALFAINDFLVDNGGTPNDQFRQSPLGSAKDCIEYQHLAEDFAEDAFTLDQLEQTEQALSKLATELEEAGHSY